jgi:hypothetical protein
MIENVAVIGPHTGIIGIEDHFDCGFWRNQDGVAFCACDFLPVTIVRTKCSVTCRLLTHFSSGAAENNAAQFVPETSH